VIVYSVIINIFISWSNSFLPSSHSQSVDDCQLSTDNCKSIQMSELAVIYIHSQFDI
jgi:hypothetical protein